MSDDEERKPTGRIAAVRPVAPPVFVRERETPTMCPCPQCCCKTCQRRDGFCAFCNSTGMVKPDDRARWLAVNGERPL